ncbi:MAG: hypothetical protein GXX08_09000 [Firmicutes bacterium]|nr:hypothetical protein [Bacillota bacterium]
MESSWKYRFLVKLCLRLRLSIALKRGYAVTTFKMSNDAMAPELRTGDLVAVDTRSAGQPVRVGDLVVASIKCASWDTASEGGSSSDRESSSEDSESAGEEERRLVVRKVAAVAGDPIPHDGPGSGSAVPEGCVYLLANDRSKGPDSRTSDVGARPLSDILGRVVAVRRGGRITWL